MKHGHWGYKCGCRCDTCRAAQAAACAMARELALDRPIPDHVHGTATGYSFWACRCDPCCDAKSRANREYRERRRAANIAAGKASGTT